MVRIVSCHHFLSQDVFLSQSEPVAFCCAQGKLLIATTQHVINVHDLESRGNVLHSFPTIDLVKQLIYCESGKKTFLKFYFHIIKEHCKRKLLLFFVW